jgi:hypothetical protein
MADTNTYERITTVLKRSDSIQLITAEDMNSKIVDISKYLDKYKSTFNRTYAVVKMFSYFPVINRNKDAFLYEDTSGKYKDLEMKDNPIVNTLVGSSFKYNHEPVTQVIGNYVEVDNASDCLRGIVTIDRSLARKYDIQVKHLKDDFDTSIEAFIDPVNSKYFKQTSQVADYNTDTLLSWDEVKKWDKDGKKDIADPSKYDYRLARVMELTGGAAIETGKQADITAGIEYVAANDKSGELDEMKPPKEEIKNIEDSQIGEQIKSDDGTETESEDYVTPSSKALRICVLSMLPVFQEWTNRHNEMTNLYQKCLSLANIKDNEEINKEETMAETLVNEDKTKENEYQRGWDECLARTKKITERKKMVCEIKADANLDDEVIFSMDDKDFENHVLKLKCEALELQLTKQVETKVAPVEEVQAAAKIKQVCPPSVVSEEEKTNRNFYLG